MHTSSLTHACTCTCICIIIIIISTYCYDFVIGKHSGVMSPLYTIHTVHTLCTCMYLVNSPTVYVHVHVSGPTVVHNHK